MLVKPRDDIGRWAGPVGLTTLFCFLLLAPLGAVIARDNAGAGILAGVGVTAIILTRLRDLISFSGLGVKATLEKKVAEVDDIIRQLQSVSKALARVSLQEMAMSGQMLSGVNTGAKFKARDDITFALKKIGVSEEEIIETHEVWIEVFGNILLDMIVYDAAKISLMSAVKEEVSGLPRIASYGLPTPDALNGWALTKSGDHLMTLCKEYRSLIETGGMAEPNLIPFNSAFGRFWLDKDESDKTEQDG